MTQVKSRHKLEEKYPVDPMKGKECQTMVGTIDRLMEEIVNRSPSLGISIWFRTGLALLTSLDDMREEGQDRHSVFILETLKEALEEIQNDPAHQLKLAKYIMERDAKVLKQLAEEKNDIQI